MAIRLGGDFALILYMNAAFISIHPYLFVFQYECESVAKDPKDPTLMCTCPRSKLFKIIITIYFGFHLKFSFEDLNSFSTGHKLSAKIKQYSIS